MLEGENVTTRFIGLPFVFILIFAVIYFQEWLEHPQRNLTLVYVITFAGLLISLNDLWQNYRIWRVVATAFTFEKVRFDPRDWVVANHPDPVYANLVLAGIILSVVSLGVLLFFTWRSRRESQLQPD